ncbi:cupin 2, conserved barrel domain protein [Luminiphilus syltensis NOR5-1B]|uniref:Cupin 2, conserved barrel domain protein n=1 Tax=Luminiphilus syltensis NOR5-1B TaxID=565045 RepID=B8KTX7_9GAMM|nr:cupin 2, conserved barrel domain protein [Luminiphilus syltensis NOR5-1B]
MSKRQPFCDGSHQGTGIEPLIYEARSEGEEVLFCNCKKTSDGPHCDGSHNAIPGAYSLDDPQSAANRAIPQRDFDAATATAALDDNCYVFSTSRAERVSARGMDYCKVISPAQGALYQSQFHATVRDETDFISFGDRHVVLFIADGGGRITIGTKTLSIASDSGVYIRPGEDFQLCPEPTLEVYISACPAAEAPEFSATSSAGFDADYPERRVAVDPDKRNAMAARYFQMLVDKSIGSDVATQFIGHIPESKAAPHRHLYEEALIILKGKGMMWTQTGRAPVEAGDVIFLPAKCEHSLEATNAAGMDVVGVIYPGDNPSINY